MKILDRLKKNWLVRLLYETVNDFGADNGNLLSAAVAYNLLFSLFPFALALISIAGFIMQSPVFEQKVINSLGGMLPIAGNIISTTLHEMVNARAETGAIAVLGLVWSASSFFTAVRNALNRAWGVKARASFFKGEAMDITMMICAFILLTLYIWLTTGLRILHIRNFHSDSFEFLNSTTLSATVFTIVSAVLAFLIILLLYKFIPSERPRWRDIWPGALIAAAGFEIVRFAFIWYIKNFDHYNLVYGSLGAVFALLAFIYIAAWILLFCAKLCAVNARMKAGRV
jgi:membrane protein